MSARQMERRWAAKLVLQMEWCWAQESLVQQLSAWMSLTASRAPTVPRAPTAWRAPSVSMAHGDWVLQRQFILTLAKTFAEDTTIRYGVVQFSADVREERPVSFYWPEEARTMVQMRRSTSIGGGLVEGGRQLQRAPHSDFENRVIVLFTDGCHNSNPSIQTGLDEAVDSAWARLYVVAVGSYFCEYDMDQMRVRGGKMYTVATYSHLVGELHTLHYAITGGSGRL